MPRLTCRAYLQHYNDDDFKLQAMASHWHTQMETLCLAYLHFQDQETSNTKGRRWLALYTSLVQNEATEGNASKHDGSGDSWKMYLVRLENSQLKNSGDSNRSTPGLTSLRSCYLLKKAHTGYLIGSCSHRGHLSLHRKLKRLIWVLSED